MSKTAALTNSNSELRARAALRRGVLSSPFIIFGCTIAALYLHERSSGGSREGFEAWFAAGLLIGIGAVVALIAFFYRRGRSVTRTLRLDANGIAVDDVTVRWADAAHLLAAITWDNDVKAWAWDFRWLSSERSELLRVGAWEYPRAQASGDGTLVADGVIAPDGALALALEAEAQFALHQTALREFSFRSGPVTLVDEGIDFGGKLVSWKQVTRASRTNGTITLTIDGDAPFELRRPDAMDYLAFSHSLERAGIAVHAAAPVEACWQVRELTSLA